VRSGSLDYPAGQIDAERTTWFVDQAADGSLG
jgi:hypothetical protein